MPPRIDAVGDLIRVTVAFQFPDSQIEMTGLHYLCVTSGGTDSRAGVGNSLYNLLGTNWLPLMSDQSSIFGYKVGLVSPHPIPLPKTLVNIQPGGDTGVNCLATQSRPVCRVGTAMGGRSGRGRLYLPTPSVGQISTIAFLGNTAFTAMGVIAASLPATVTTGGSSWVPVLAHRHAGPPVSWTTDDITTGLATRQIGTQRKSGNYGRTNGAPW